MIIDQNNNNNKTIYSGGAHGHSSVDDASEDAYTGSTKENISTYPPCFGFQAHDFPHNPVVKLFPIITNQSSHCSVMALCIIFVHLLLYLLPLETLYRTQVYLQDIQNNFMYQITVLNN